ncbi:ORF6N domain-containing protein [Pectobacterium cacticida]|uniref:ORF6N domain-containing protein n=1 Tax=Pectobacterium cacticida TaxID=69221 RepID=UPI00398780CA
MKNEMVFSGQGDFHTKNPATQSMHLPIIEWQGVRVVTTETLATGYDTGTTNIRTNLSSHRQRFTEGIHYFNVAGGELAQLRVSNADAQISNKARSVTLWTERGAARMSKVVDTDAAWSFFEILESCYFTQKRDQQLPLAAPNFTDPAAAARAWADEFEAKQKAIALMHQQSEYIEQLEQLFANGLSPVQFCKRLNGVNCSKVNAYLASVGWLYDDNPEGNNARWRVYAYARDRYLTEKTRTITPPASEGFIAYNPVLLRKGALWIYRHYLNGELPMKSNWNGEFTHDKDLSGGKHASAQ